MSEILFMLLGALIAHLLHRVRDRANVFNAATKPLRAQLLTHLSNLDSRDISGRISEQMVLDAIAELHPKEAKKIRARYEKYQSVLEEVTKPDEFGLQKAPDADGISRIRTAANALNRSVRPRM